MTIVASFGVPKYLTSIFSTRPTFSRCFFCSKSKILFLLRLISSNDKFPERNKQNHKHILHFFTENSLFCVSIKFLTWLLLSLPRRFTKNCVVILIYLLFLSIFKSLSVKKSIVVGFDGIHCKIVQSKFERKPVKFYSLKKCFFLFSSKLVHPHPPIHHLPR